MPPVTDNSVAMVQRDPLELEAALGTDAVTVSSCLSCYHLSFVVVFGSINVCLANPTFTSSMC